MLTDPVLQGVAVLRERNSTTEDLIDQLRTAGSGNVHYTPANGTLMVALIGEQSAQAARPLIEQLEPYLEGASQFILHQCGRMIDWFCVGPEKGAFTAPETDDPWRPYA